MEEGGATAEAFFPPPGSLELLGSRQADSEVKTILNTGQTGTLSHSHTKIKLMLRQLSYVIKTQLKARGHFLPSTVFL